MSKALVVVTLAFFLCSSFAQTNLVFYDDFNELDFEVWSHEITLSGGGNWEFEYYTNNRSNSYVRNSILYLKPTLTADTIGEANVQNGYTMDLWGGSPADVCTGNTFYGCERTSGAGGNIINPVQSAALRSVGGFNFKYGRLEVSAKLPRGDWLWPAIWLLPKRNAYGEWPASGEIDIVESRGNDASYSAGGVNQFSSTLHWGPFYGQDNYQATHQAYTLPSGDLSQAFHTYGLIWTNTSITTYIDDPSNVVLNVPIKQSFWELGGWANSTLNNPWVGRGNDAPFDQPFYVIFNVACGGTNGYFPDGVGNKPWTDASPNAVDAFYQAKQQWLATWQGENAALQIDWIKIWQ